jgi:Tfp pilus assembly protein PilX
MSITKPTIFKKGNESGSALIVALVVLVAVAIIGMVALQYSTNEVKMAASDRNYKQAFYGADGAIELATELLEQNVESISGFAESTLGSKIEFGENFTVDGQIDVVNTVFWTNDQTEATKPSDTNRDFYMPKDATEGQPRTNFKLGGRPGITPGSAIQMAAGYEGRGKSAAQGGTHLVYTVNAQHSGHNDSEAIVRVEWRHVN